MRYHDDDDDDDGKLKKITQQTKWNWNTNTMYFINSCSRENERNWALAVKLNYEKNEIEETDDEEKNKSK